jgi:hypothetical protein
MASEPPKVGLFYMNNNVGRQSDFEKHVLLHLPIRATKRSKSGLSPLLCLSFRARTTV